MIRIPTTVLTSLLLVSPAFAVGNSNVNVDITTSTIESDRVAEVEVTGDTVYVFPDPYTAPELSDVNAAVDTALVALGYPAGSGSIQQTLSIGTDSVFAEVVTSNYNPIDDPTFVIGDPEDYSTWIAIGPEDVNVQVVQTTTNYEFFRVVVSVGSPCGDGILDAGESCDDGNTEDGDCCSSTCTFETNGSPCDDGVACTALDTCDGLGTCVAGGPDDACLSSWAKATLLIKEKKAGKEKLIAKFTRGPALLQTDFGDPVSGATSYDLCLFDDQGALLSSLTVDRAAGLCAGKDCWKAKKDTGWQYKDKNADSDGVAKMKLFGGSEGKTQVQVLAANNDKKGLVSMPTGLAAALQGSTSARVQLRSSDAECFDVTLDQIKKQEPDFFKAIRK